MRVYQDYWRYLLFLLLKHGHQKYSAIVGTDNKDWVVNGGIDCLLSDCFIRKEELELVLVIVVPHKQGVEINKAIANTLGEEVCLVYE